MILLVGGGGFIGRHLIAAARADDPEMVVVGRTSRPLGATSGVRYIGMRELVAEEGRHLVEEASASVYLASTSVPSTFASSPWQEVPNNVEVAARFFHECAAINPRAKIVLISSGGTIYGKIESLPVAEDHPKAPISGYGLAKLMMEEALRFTSRTCGVPFNILRLSNPVGRFQTNLTQGIVPIALRGIRDGVPFNVFGDGSSIRDYVDADDVACAIRAVCLDRMHPNQTWNVGSGIGHSVLDILALVENVSGRRIDIRYHAARSVDVPEIVLDSTRIADALGWTPTRPLADACADIWQQLNASVPATDPASVGCR